ncbi:hypothetical protein [Actinoplanes sp. NPDC051859]|uniref:hypothetical protein n=1 Tax=Actinoplanes sp. NPDC051859 TaxID=3363909 RepID=UPI003798EB45
MTSINALSSTSSTAYTQAPRPMPRNGENPMVKVAETLGLSGEELKSQLDSGKSLNDVASAQGVSHDDLIASIKAGMPTDATGSVDADTMAEKIASSTGAPPPPPPGGPRGENAGIRDSSKLQQLSKLLEMDSATVTDEATSASSLVNLLQSKGVDLGALRNVLNNGDLLDVAA